jgi:hypothetical protein
MERWSHSNRQLLELRADRQFAPEGGRSGAVVISAAAPKTPIRKSIQADLAVQPRCENIRLRRRANHGQLSARSVPARRGVSRSSRTLDAGCDGRTLTQETNAAARGRRSRVVLAPRRWRELLKKLTLLRGDGDKKPDRRRERGISRKPSRRECRIVRPNLWWTCSCASSFRARGYG